MANLSTNRAGKTAAFAGSMQRTVLDLTVRRDTYNDEIENDKNQIYQLELEVSVLQGMSAKLGERIERREIAQAEFEKTYTEAKQASKKLKQATNSLASICVKV
jgi:SMC interacting uncharacterized protein involved in chromosome segregation